MENNTGVKVYPFRNQYFNIIQKRCLKQRILFEDPYFELDSQYEWKRPWEITRDPKLYEKGVTRHDVFQGELGDCWMLAAISDLAMQPELLKRVIPPYQSFTRGYAGVFHFRFFQFGVWFDVVIDDRLPTRDGKLVYLRAGSGNEYWPPLLEKAYCKILGSAYISADAGNLCEAMEDFTGGIVEQHSLRNPPSNLQNILLKSDMRRSFMGCFIDANPDIIEQRSPEGLVAGHSYSITRVKNVNIPGHGDVVLLRIRNPWGEYEWNGAWSDNSKEWKSVPNTTKQELGLVYENEGEFWMSYPDFVKYFQWLDMCHLSPDAFKDGAVSKDTSLNWQFRETKGSWVKGVTAGGGGLLHLNPQFRIALNEADDDDHDGRCSILIALMQRPKGTDRLAYHEIGFRIYRADDPRYNQASLDQYYLKDHAYTAQIPVKSVREVCGRYDLEPGVYIIIPFTYETGNEGDFLLRVYTEKRTEVDTMDYRVSLSPVDVRVSDTPPMKGDDDEEDRKREENVKDFFDKMTGGDMEANWKELKEILDFAVKNDVAACSSAETGVHVLLDIASFVMKTFFGKEVANAFETVECGGFPKDVCRSMIALMDVDHSGKLNYDEFKILWSEIQSWKSIYQIYSKEKKGFLTSSELKEALDSAGYRLNNRILADLIHRYANKNDMISFDDFLQCAIKLKTMTDFFKSKDTTDSDKAEFTLEEFIERILYS